MKYARTLLFVTLLFSVACGPTKHARIEYTEQYDRPERIEQAIRKGKITTGMTKADADASWGSPDHVNESYYQGVGGKTQWCYDRGYSMQCVYFEGGVVTGWN